MLLCDVAKYFATSHGILAITKYFLTNLGIFCHVTSLVCSDMNNGLLTLNMGLAKKAINTSIV
jgi:hypothetical protein